MSKLTILQLDKVLRDEVLSLKAVKEERMKEVIELKTIDEEVCAKLKLEPIYVPSKVVPTDEQMETLKKHIRDMKVSNGLDMNRLEYNLFPAIYCPRSK